MQRFVASPADYLKDIPANQLPAVELLRKMIREAAPKLKEKINYGMLCYADADGDALALAAQKHTVCLYVRPQAVAMMADELAAIDHGKSCLRFPKLEKIPAATIKKLLKLAMSMRAAEGPTESAGGSQKTSRPTKTKKKAALQKKSSAKKRKT